MVLEKQNLRYSHRVCKHRTLPLQKVDKYGYIERIIFIMVDTTFFQRECMTLAHSMTVSCTIHQLKKSFLLCSFLFCVQEFKTCSSLFFCLCYVIECGLLCLCMNAHNIHCFRCYKHEFLKDFFLSTGQLQVCLISLSLVIDI